MRWTGDILLDPDGMLLSIRSAARALATSAAECAPAEERAALGDELAQLIITFDHYLAAGGEPPADWRPVASWQQGNRRAQLPGPARHRRRPW